MNSRQVRQLLQQVAAGRLTVGEAAARLNSTAEPPLDFARLDHDRERRCGFPEVIFCQGKRPEQVAAIFARLSRKHDRVLATRVGPEACEAVLGEVPAARYHEAARALTWWSERPRLRGRVAILAAGTADVPVAEEARVTAEIMGARTLCHYDVGVAGLHRLLGIEAELRRARVVVVVAGMEGALPSVVAGRLHRPVIAVPTSVGYGASLGGLAALLGMLNSCAAGVSVVNIDNGFGGGYCAALINSRPPPPPSPASHG